jgi:hypothetical protein
MVERRLLTAAFVDSVTLPNRGERWIADTRLRGFGLRLWRSTGGEGKAFAIRAIDTKGRQIRRTYDGEARNEYWSPHQRRTLGDALDSARDWAADELCRAMGRPTLREEEDNHRKRISKRLSKLTLDDLVQARFRGMRIRGLTEQYIVTLIAIYERHVPLKLRSTKISKVRPKALTKIFRSLSEKPGLARTLRSFLGQIIDDVGFHSRPLYRAFYFAREADPSLGLRHNYNTKRPVPKKLFDGIFESLNRVEKNWLQALFIRLLFEFDAPADRLMKAEWRHIANNRWYPWLRGERDYWWLHARPVNDTTEVVLRTLRNRSQREFGNSHFLFPSELSSIGHIRTFRGVWRLVASECEIDPSDLLPLIREYHWPPTPLRRIVKDLRYYGKIVQDVAPSPELLS